MTRRLSILGILGGALALLLIAGWAASDAWANGDDSGENEHTAICLLAAGGATPVTTVEGDEADGDEDEANEENESDEGQESEPTFTGSIPVCDALQQVATIDATAAQQAAQQAVPGTVEETALEVERGYVVYEVEVTGDDGQSHEVIVDAGDGTVLGQESGEESEEEE